MTLSEAMAQLSPTWLTIWLNILMVGAFLLPVALFIWKPTRMTAVYCLVAGALGAFGVGWMYEQMGYVKLLGLPHILVWTPLSVHLWLKFKSPDVSKVPRIIIGLIMATILISLAFDYTDIARYLLGERTPLAVAAT